MSTARDQVLGLPELVAAILDQICDAPSRFACAQVNKLFAEVATSLLWAYTPPISALAALRNDRLQYYAEKIISIGFPIEDDGCKSRLLSSINFPRLTRLRHIAMAAREDNDENSLLMQIHARCPNIRVIDVDDVLGNISTAALLLFLRSTPSVYHITFRGSLETVTDELYVYLATRSNLVGLWLCPNVLTRSLVLRIEEATDHPFQHLEDFGCIAESGSHSRGLRSLCMISWNNLLFSRSGTYFFSSAWLKRSVQSPDNVLRLYKAIAVGPGDEIMEEVIERFVAGLPKLRVLRSFFVPHAYPTIVDFHNFGHYYSLSCYWSPAI